MFRLPDSSEESAWHLAATPSHVSCKSGMFEAPQMTLPRPWRLLKGLTTAHLLYPVAEALEKRDVRSKVAELRRHYAMSPGQRLEASKARLVEILVFAGSNVPYYRDLFARLAFDPEKVAADPRRLEQLPLLTKDIIR